MMLPLGAEVVIRYALPFIVCLLAIVLDSASESCSTIKNKSNEVCEVD